MKPTRAQKERVFRAAMRWFRASNGFFFREGFRVNEEEKER